MSEDRLYFNGIRPDGSYALSPKTAEELADRIWAARSREDALTEQLARAFESADKVLDIVDSLVDESLKLIGGEAMTREAWLEALARRLLVIILGEAFASAGNIRALARRLRQETRQKVAVIVRAFVQPGAGQNRQALEALILPQRAADDVSYKETLKQLVAHWGAAIRNDLLSPARAHALTNTPEARAPWLASLCRLLKALPIESLRALTENRSVVSAPLRRLLPALRALPDVGSAWLVQLIADLEPIAAQGRHASWPTVVDVLETDLQPITREDAPPVAWEPLFGALTTWLNVLSGEVGKLGAVPWVDPLKLEEAGWGVIFPAEMADERLVAIKAALQPLLDMRKAQAGARYAIFQGGKGFRPDENARAFLGRFGADPSQPADPGTTGVPYYLLLVGSPVEIPFAFQYGLDVQYAVGRVDFDAVEDYATYARSVVAAEQVDFRVAPEALFVAVENSGDKATRLSAAHLVAPVSRHLAERVAQKAWTDSHPAWHVAVVPPEEATRAKLLDIVSREQAPALLFTASHGLEAGPDDPQQQAKQGALVCGDWRGPGHPVPAEFYLSGDVLAAHDEANLLGTIAFLFACYGAGTPETDDYFRQEFEEQGAVIAEQPFIAALPKAMLSLRSGGALAVVGHIERVWSLSFLGPEQISGLGEPRRSEHVAVFESMIEQLLQGYPVGAAMDYFGARYAALSTELTAAFDAFREPDDFELAELWTANHDARGYVIVGDPAVRLRVAATAAQATARKDLERGA